MLTLFHHPFCPHSRVLRVALAEHSLAPRLIEERVWERRQDFVILNPACATPVLVAEGEPALTSPAIAVEYLDETYGEDLNERRLLPQHHSARVETRRLMEWFNIKFFNEVSGPLVMERIYKRSIPEDHGGGAPHAETIRAARLNMRYHLAYLGWLAQTRDWLGGERISYADITAAAHLSVVDYLGDIPWDEDGTAKAWYARIKSRPSFRSLLSDTVPGMLPPASYTDLDF